MYELLFATVFFICLALTFFVGYKLGQYNKPAKHELTEDELRAIRKRDEGFKNIMNYDYLQALQRQVK